MNIRLRIALFVAIWAGIVSLSFMWNYHKATVEQRRIAYETAKGFFDLILITRD